MDSHAKNSRIPSRLTVCCGIFAIQQLKPFLRISVSLHSYPVHSLAPLPYMVMLQDLLWETYISINPVNFPKIP